MTVRYLIGPPGVGKSTALASVTSGWSLTLQLKPFAHQVSAEGIVLGRGDRDFPGTDTLSMSVLPKAVDWLERQPDSVLIVGEGDRLATVKFFEAATVAGHDVRVAALVAPKAVVAARAKARGSEQAAAWVSGRWTKTQRLIAALPVRVVDATRPADTVAAEISDWIRER